MTLCKQVKWIQIIEATMYTSDSWILHDRHKNITIKILREELQIINGSRNMRMVSGVQ
jgi:hypothetical protein